MRIELSPTSHLPGLMIVVAETPVDILYLRQFCNWTVDHPNAKFGIMNFGGNYSEGKMSMAIGYHTPEED